MALKPLLLFTAVPAEGHINPLLAIAAHLIANKYEVAFLCTPSFKQKIENAGAEFIPCVEIFADGEGLVPPEVVDLPPCSVERGLLQYSHIFHKRLPLRFRDAQRALAMLRKRQPERQIIVVEDLFNMCTLPLAHDAPLPCGFTHPPKRIGVSPTVLMAQSRDLAPAFLGLPPDASESGRLRNGKLQKLMDSGPMLPVREGFHGALKACQCTAPDADPITVQYLSWDRTLILCSPGLEYPRSDLPPTVEFIGTLPQASLSPSYQFPPWWPDVLRGDKKVVFVCQGTINMDYHELVAPTLQALSDRDDISVIAALGSRGAVLPEDVEVPRNARVVDYIPYDAVLAHADVFVSNAGFGALSHAVTNGVPLVMAGQTEEKAEVAMRAEVAGMARNLRTQFPTVEQLQEAVEDVLGDAGYKARAMELRRENEGLDCLKRIEEVVASMVEP